MNSRLLEAIGLGNLDIAYIFVFLLVWIVVLTVFIIIQINQNKKLRKKYEKFMQGKNASSLEDKIAELCEEHEALMSASSVHNKQLRDLYKKQKKDFQKFSIVKYDAFSQQGGKLSYCIVMLDEDNNGFILNYVHGTEGCYSYIKHVKNGSCDIELAKEEKHALEKAMATE